VQLTLGDIGDLFKMAHEQQLEIQRLKLQIQELQEALERKKDADMLAGKSRSSKASMLQEALERKKDADPASAWSRDGRE